MGSVHKDTLLAALSARAGHLPTLAAFFASLTAPSPRTSPTSTSRRRSADGSVGAGERRSGNGLPATPSTEQQQAQRAVNKGERRNGNGVDEETSLAELVAAVRREALEQYRDEGPESAVGRALEDALEGALLRLPATLRPALTLQCTRRVWQGLPPQPEGRRQRKTGAEPTLVQQVRGQTRCCWNANGAKGKKAGKAEGESERDQTRKRGKRDGQEKRHDKVGSKTRRRKRERREIEGQRDGNREEAECAKETH